MTPIRPARLSAIVAASGLALALAACGGTESPADGSAEPSTTESSSPAVDPAEAVAAGFAALEGTPISVTMDSPGLMTMTIDTDAANELMTMTMEMDMAAADPTMEGTVEMTIIRNGPDIWMQYGGDNEMATLMGDSWVHTDATSEDMTELAELQDFGATMSKEMGEIGPVTETGPNTYTVKFGEGSSVLDMGLSELTGAKAPAAPTEFTVVLDDQGRLASMTGVDEAGTEMTITVNGYDVTVEANEPDGEIIEA
ncbi:hypothetical protein LX16_5148 [Stackebrandtia albiflava]|uniref:Lipoprotein n=1 Tax=Stackebrandtia albiflava TaxID=406432 RepID=A0A562ULC8_9ACTN|nr:hypothetical protein [Stackebrandtia albiflava]TWJ06412.1 hypothetical protein LX16_5148 [Stackebrandtia albiflava]